ncbi:MAG: ACT domain-containing protein [Anaerolineae bacterium]
MSISTQEILAQATFFSDNVDYSIIRLPPKAITLGAGIVAEIGEPFVALLVDKDEVTLILPLEAVNDFGERLRSHVASPKAFRLITVDIVLDFELTGFMAHISTALAAASIPIMPLAAFSRDHVLVPADQLDIALNTLNRLKSTNNQE